jgi:hypothetical protein
MATPAKGEISFYSDDNGVRVTNSRLIIGTTTYAMLNVTSVMRKAEPPNRVGPIILLLLGVAVLAHHNTAFFGFLMLVAGVLWLKSQKTLYHLRIASASGEANAITSTDVLRVDKIVQAVNEAIIGRG